MDAKTVQLRFQFKSLLILLSKPIIKLFSLTISYIN
jgi:hypothetical protein